MPFVKSSFVLLGLAGAALHVNAATYALSDTFIGKSFLDNFHWETFSDPSGGFVNYVDQASALSSNLTYGLSLSFFVLASSGRG